LRAGEVDIKWLVGSLFYDAFSVPKLHSVDDRVMMKWKGFDRKRTWPNLKVLSRNSPGGTEENHEKPRSG